MSSVREVITEAFVRANLTARKRDLPSDMLVSGEQLLKGVLEDFSNKKYIQAYKSELEFNPRKEKIVIGPYLVAKAYKDQVTLYEYEDEKPVASSGLDGKYAYVKESKKAYQCQAVAGGGYSWIDIGDGAFLFDVLPDVEINDLMTPTQAYFKDSMSALDWITMPFISYDQFYSAGYTDWIVSWKPANVGTYELFFKPRFIQQNKTIKLIYNIIMDYKDNDVISLPAPYIELLTRALAYKVAIAYPRVDQSKKASLKEEFDELSRNLEASNASDRLITREGYGMKSYLGSFLDGSFISNGRW